MWEVAQSVLQTAFELLPMLLPRSSHSGRMWLFIWWQTADRRMSGFWNSHMFLVLILLLILAISFPVSGQIDYGPPITTIQDEGTSLTKYRKLNFIGSLISCTPNSGQKRIDCTLTTSGDLFSQYALLVGRSGTTNDLILSTSGNGTISGSTSVSGQLNLQGSSATGGVPSSAPTSANGQAINILPNIGNIGSGSVVFLAEPGATLKFNSTSSRVVGLGIGIDATFALNTWLVNVGNLNTSGSQQLGLVASQNIQNTPSGTSRQLGKWALVANDLSFTCDGTAAN